MLAPRQEVSVAKLLDYIHTRHFPRSLSGNLCHAYMQKRPSIIFADTVNAKEWLEGAKASS